MDDSSSSDSGSEGLPDIVINETGRNKRKFLSESPQDIPVDVETLSLTEFPRYEVLEEIQNALSVLGSRMERSEDTIEEQEVEEDQQVDWDDPIVSQLEELLKSNLLAIFCNAVKKIADCGYTEEVAEWAVLNSSLFHGSKDAVTNVVDGALALLKREKEFNMHKHPVFQELQGLVDYTLLEMIHVLREVRPALTIVEAMWCLLISDLNLVHACVLEGGLSGGTCGQETSGEKSTLSKSKSEISGTSESDSDKIMTPAKNSEPENPVAELASSKKESSLAPQEAKGKFPGTTGEHTQTSSRVMTADEKSGGSRKGSSTNSKRDMLRQKALHFEKNYKGRMSKGAFKAKVAAWGNMVLDKSLKSQSGSSSGATKGTYPKLTNPVSGAPVECNHQLSSNSQSVKDRVFAIPAVSSKSPASSAKVTDPRLKRETNVCDPPKNTDYYASIPFDEMLQKYIPRDDKDKTILILVPRKQALEKEIQGWTDWANEKVMQAARRLGKDKGELKLLRQEKEEMEKFNKEKQALEESTTKRLSEMEYALSNATGQIEVANSTVRRLEEENHALNKLMEDAKLQALRSASNLQEATQREQEAMKKLQTWETEKGLVQEQLTNLKRRIAELDGRIEKAKERQNQFKVSVFYLEKKKKKNSACVN